MAATHPEAAPPHRPPARRAATRQPRAAAAAALLATSASREETGQTAPRAVATFLAGPWPQKHPGSTPPKADDVLRQMWQDYATLGGQVPKGGPPGISGFTAPAAIGSKSDRPFAPRGSQQDPAAGFLTIPREVVIGLGLTVTRWGAIDFGGESGDVQHFDDMGGLGTEIAAATGRAATKIAAAGTTTTTTP